MCITSINYSIHTAESENKNPIPDGAFIFIFPMKNCNYTSHFLPNLSQISIF